MSDKPKAEENDAVEAAPAPKSKKKLIIFVVIGVVVLAVAVVGAMLMMKKKKGGEAGEGEAAEATHEEKGHEQPPVYVKLESFTTNLTPETGDQPTAAAGQYIQLVVEMKVDDAKAGEELKNYMPEIRNNILRLLSARRASQLASTEGKDLLANEIRDSVNRVISPGETKKPEKAVKGPVQTVLFSSFIVQ